MLLSYRTYVYGGGGDMSVGIIYDPIYLEHDTGVHPENAGRLTSILAFLQESRLISRLSLLAPAPATLDQLGLVHEARHIESIRKLALSGGGYLDSDTPVSTRSYEAALNAAGGTIRAVETVMQGQMESVFALVRPPGHHALPECSMGFCLFNNVAIAAAYLLKKYKMERLAVIDFDVHHGNGTQEIFNSNPQVLYISTHQSPLYPGTGTLYETGSGAAKGTKINIPLPPGCTDLEYQAVYQEVVVPAVRRFRPQFILVSAGYDAHWADTISGMQLTVKGYVQMVNDIKMLAAELSQKRLVMALEGGYNQGALAASVHATLAVLLGDNKIDIPFEDTQVISSAPDIKPLIRQIREIHVIK